jgi:divalent metal cation (Fe/Co/Zn/Cd) transporter
MIIEGYILFMAYVAVKESTLSLVDAGNDPILCDKIKEHIEKKFNIEVANVLIRPLKYFFAVETNLKLNLNSTLTETPKIVE